jgi:hypothetical protein
MISACSGDCIIQSEIESITWPVRRRPDDGLAALPIAVPIGRCPLFGRALLVGVPFLLPGRIAAEERL